ENDAGRSHNFQPGLRSIVHLVTPISSCFTIVDSTSSVVIEHSEMLESKQPCTTRVAPTRSGARDSTLLTAIGLGRRDASRRKNAAATIVINTITVIARLAAAKISVQLASGRSPCLIRALIRE